MDELTAQAAAATAEAEEARETYRVLQARVAKLEAFRGPPRPSMAFHGLRLTFGRPSMTFR